MGGKKTSNKNGTKKNNFSEMEVKTRHKMSKIKLFKRPDASVVFQVQQLMGPDKLISNFMIGLLDGKGVVVN